MTLVPMSCVLILYSCKIYNSRPNKIKIALIIILVTLIKNILDVFKNVKPGNNNYIIANQQVSHKTKSFRLKKANENTENKISNNVTQNLKHIKLSSLINLRTSFFISIKLFVMTQQRNVFNHER